MNIIIQYPITDLRPFIKGETYRLDKPSWRYVNDNIPNDYKPYLRYFGSIQKNVDYYNKFSTGEKCYCKTKNAVKFPKDKILFKLKKSDYCMRIVSSKLYSDGYSLCKLELILNVHPYNQYKCLEPFEIINLIKKVLLIKVAVRNIPNTKESAIQYLGTYIRKLYLAASTEYKAYAANLAEDYWLETNDPVVLVEYFSDEVFELPQNVQRIEVDSNVEQENINLSYCILENDKNYLKTWFIEKDVFTNRDLLKNLRTCILRLHQEKENLRSILRFLNEDRRLNDLKDVSKNLEAYLVKVTNNVFIDRKYGQPQQEILEQILSYEKTFLKDEYEDLKSILEELAGCNQIEKITNIFNQVNIFDENVHYQTDRCIDANGSEEVKEKTSYLSKIKSIMDKMKEGNDYISTIEAVAGRLIIIFKIFGII